VRWIAEEFGKRFGITPVFSGQESDRALLSNAAKCQKLFGPPEVTPSQMIDWIADWISRGGELLNKPTHFEAQDGKF
jgi:hypothetical protein